MIHNNDITQGCLSLIVLKREIALNESNTDCNDTALTPADFQSILSLSLSEQEGNYFRIIIEGGLYLDYLKDESTSETFSPLELHPQIQGNYIHLY